MASISFLKEANDFKDMGSDSKTLKVFAYGANWWKSLDEFFTSWQLPRREKANLTLLGWYYNGEHLCYNAEIEWRWRGDEEGLTALAQKANELKLTPEKEKEVDEIAENLGFVPSWLLGNKSNHECTFFPYEMIR
jgi:hypothetical protein